MGFKTGGPARSDGRPARSTTGTAWGSDQLPHSEITAASGTVSLSLQSSLHHSITLLMHYRFR